MYTDRKKAGSVVPLGQETKQSPISPLPRPVDNIMMQYADDVNDPQHCQMRYGSITDGKECPLQPATSRCAAFCEEKKLYSLFAPQNFPFAYKSADMKEPSECNEISVAFVDSTNRQFQLLLPTGYPRLIGANNGYTSSWAIGAKGKSPNDFKSWVSKNMAPELQRRFHWYFSGHRLEMNGPIKTIYFVVKYPTKAKANPAAMQFFNVFGQPLPATSWYRNNYQFDKFESNWFSTNRVTCVWRYPVPLLSQSPMILGPNDVLQRY